MFGEAEVAQTSRAGVVVEDDVFGLLLVLERKTGKTEEEREGGMVEGS